METIGWLGSIGGIVSVFILLNGFLFTVGVSISDYFLANGFLLMVGYLAYLTIAIRRIEGQDGR